MFRFKTHFRAPVIFYQGAFPFRPAISQFLLPETIQDDIFSNRFSTDHLWGPFRAHSHITRNLQPASFNSCWCFWSFLLLPVIFVRQNLEFDFGHLNKWQLWPCQKQPLIMTTTWCLGNTRSGVPGNRLSCFRNRKPRANNPLRKTSSGFVFLPRIPDIILLRISGETTSIFLGVRRQIQ